MTVIHSDTDRRCIRDHVQTAVVPLDEEIIVVRIHTKRKQNIGLDLDDAVDQGSEIMDLIIQILTSDNLTTKFMDKILYPLRREDPEIVVGCHDIAFSSVGMDQIIQHAGHLLFRHGGETERVVVCHASFRLLCVKIQCFIFVGTGDHGVPRGRKGGAHQHVDMFLCRKFLRSARRQSRVSAVIPEQQLNGAAEDSSVRVDLLCRQHVGCTLAVFIEGVGSGEVRDDSDPDIAFQVKFGFLAVVHILFRKPDPHDAAFVQESLNGDPAAEAFHAFLDGSKSDSVSLKLTFILKPLERLEKIGGIFLIEPDAVVTEAVFHTALPRPGGYGYMRRFPSKGEFNTVGKDIADSQTDHEQIPVQFRKRVHVELDVTMVISTDLFIKTLPDQKCHIYLLFLHDLETGP